MARNRIATKEIDTENNAVVFNFTDEESVAVNVSDFSDDIKARLLLHGVSQKLGDSYSGAETAAEARETMLSSLEALKNGEFNIRSAGGGTRTTLLAEALARVTKQDVQLCQDKISEMDKEQLKKLRAHADIQKAQESIKIEKAQEKLEKVSAEAENAEPLANLFG